MEYYSKIKKEHYRKISGKWELIETELSVGHCGREHWEGWREFDRNLNAWTSLKCNGDTMASYTTISPNKAEKVTYTRVGAVKSTREAVI